MGLTEWIIGTVAGGMVSLLGFFAWQDRSRIASDSRDAKTEAQAAKVSIGVMEARLSAVDGRLGRIELVQERIEKQQGEMLIILRNGNR